MTEKNNHQPQIVSVLVPMPVDIAFHYIIAAHLPHAQNVKIGSIVQIPLGSRQVFGIINEINSKPDIPVEKLRNISKIMDCEALSKNFMRFIDFVAEYSLSPKGMVAQMALRSKTAFDKEPETIGLHIKGDNITKGEKEKENIKKSLVKSRIFDALKNGQILSRPALTKATKATKALIDRLIAQGILEEVPMPAKPLVALPNPNHAPPILEDCQKQAVLALLTAFDEPKCKPIVLDGVTGAGKTEVYFEAVAKALSLSRQVLILLPEIALTQQFLDRFQARFGAYPAQWHSDITPKQREKIWRQTRDARIKVVVGARSALFLPFENLGLIIVDEEHDASYKQEERIFYNARDMAVARASFENIPIILSSATPSLESQVNCLQNRYRAVHLPSRFKQAALPNLSAIDMRKDPPTMGRFISPPLQKAMEETLNRKEQSLIFLNRRGYAPLTLCRVCGHRFQCKNCSSWLVEHRFHKKLICHHCGYFENIPKACPECNAADHLVACGPGVERIAEEISHYLPKCRLLILSTDLIHSIQQLRTELSTIKNGEVDIIIGTQLVAKGHDFPNISLVGVIDADLGLANGDPRAGERTFQLLSQVTGRAGRSGLKSQGFIQTYQPEHPVMQAIILGDVKAFYHREIAAREHHKLPPFGRLAALIISSEKRTLAEAHAKALRRAAPTNPNISVLGPAEAPLAYIRGRYRFRLLLHGTKTSHMQAYIKSMLHICEKPKSAVHVQIDIDPQSFL